MGVLEEVFICMKFLNASYSDVMRMPIYERRFFIDKLIELKEKEQEAYKKASKKGG